MAKKSKRRSFGMVLLLSMLIIVIVFYSFIIALNKKSESGNGSSTLDPIKYIDKQENDVLSITYIKNGGSEFTVKKLGGTYVLEGDENFPLDSSVVRFMTNAVAQVSFSRKFAPDGNDLTEYGLAEPNMMLNVVYTDGARLEMNIGSYNNYAQSYYCTVGDGFVYLLSSDFSEAFDYEFKDLLLDDIITVPQNGFSSLTAIEITENGKETVFTKNDDDSWTKTISGVKQDGDFSETAQSIYREMFLIDLDEWADYKADSDEARDAYGLKKPEIRVLFRHIESEDFEVEGSSTVTKEKEITSVFLIGYSFEDEGEDETDTLRYFMTGDGHVVYKIDQEQIETVLENK